MNRAAEYVPQYGLNAVSGTRVTVVWLVVLGMSLLVLMLEFAAPILKAAQFSTFSFFIYQAFSFTCHQIPERSFYVALYPMAVCARCAGLYAGFAIGTAVYPIVRAGLSDGTPGRKWLVAAAIPSAVDFVLGISGLWANTHWSRFLTSTLLGTVGAFFVVPGLIELSRYEVTRFFRRDAPIAYNSTNPIGRGGDRVTEVPR